jgi:hypothetical protein
LRSTSIDARASDRQPKFFESKQLANTTPSTPLSKQNHWPPHINRLPLDCRAHLNTLVESVGRAIQATIPDDFARRSGSTKKKKKKQARICWQRDKKRSETVFESVQ